MCGIAGRVNFKSGAPVDPLVVGGMTRLLAHRGPDGHGVHCVDHVGFGHRRLAIIDPSPLGRQPMVASDDSCFITFNGEIYNFLELRADLAGKGHRFQSHTDTEVILAAYREYGVACLERLDGMFAFAIWDRAARRLVIARDRLGKKPLYYRLDDNGIAFASESKAFLAEPGFRPEVNLQALSAYLSFQYVPAPMSAFKGVATLPPAHVLTIAEGRLSITRYWKLSYAHKIDITDDDAVDAVSERLRAAVKRRMISDVPLGAFLSGGIDSGLVVSYMAECQSAPVRTFSIGFDQKEYNELPAARLVAARYGTAHEEFVVTPDAISLLPQLVWHYGEPFADSSALPTYVLSELTRQHVTVALNGDGGDENFAGYDRYYASVLAQRADAAPLAVRRAVAAVTAHLARSLPTRTLLRASRFAARIVESPARRYASWMMHFDPEAKRALCSPEFRAATTDDSVALIEQAFATSDAAALLERTLDVDVRTYLPDDLLVKVDVATMAHGLEGRSPFLDHEFMQFVATLPPHLKLKGREKKHLLRRLAATRLPAELLSLPKRGFGVPIDHWFQHELREFTRTTLLDGTLARRGYFDMGVVARLVDEHVSGRGRWHYQLWNLVMLELWHRMFIDARPSGPPVRAERATVETRA